MKSSFFLRIASILTLIHAAMHTIGGVFGKPAPGPATAAVLAMKTNSFLLMGNLRTYWGFYRGFGLAITIFLTAEAIVFWQLSLLTVTEVRRLRFILITFLIAYAALAVNSYLYFFAAAVIVEAVIAACLLVAIITAKSQPASLGQSR
jgi:hypothetical protein